MGRVSWQLTVVLDSFGVRVVTPRTRQLNDAAPYPGSLYWGSHLSKIQ